MLGNQAEVCEKVGKELQKEEELTRQRCVEVRRGEAGIPCNRGEVGHDAALTQSDEPH